MDGFQMETFHMESFLAGMEYQKKLLKQEKKKKPLSISSTHYMDAMSKLAIYDPEINSFITKEEMKEVMGNWITPNKYNRVLRQIGCREVKRNIEEEKRNCWLFTKEAINEIHNIEN